MRKGSQISSSSDLNDQILPQTQKATLYISAQSYFVLFLFCLAEIGVSLLFLTCAPIAIPLSDIYQKDAVVIGAVSTVQMFLYPIFTYPTTLMMNKYGLKSTVIIGQLLVTVGAGIRCMVWFDKQFYWVLAGSALIGIGRPFLINPQADMAVIWFPKEKRIQIIALLNFLVIVCLTGGVLLSSMAFYGYNNDAYYGEIRFKYLVLGEFGFTAITFLMILSFFPKRKLGSHRQQVDFKAQSKALLKNKRYLAVFCSFSICIGSLKASNVILSFITNVFGFKTSDNGIFTFAPMLGGFLSSPFVGWAYRSTGRVKPWVLLIVFSAIGLQFVEFAAQQTKSTWIVFVTKIGIGFLQLPIGSFLIEWGCKVAYPVVDSFSIGIMYSGATLFGAFLGEIEIRLLQGNSATRHSVLITYGFVGALYFVAFLFALSSTEPHRKETRFPDEYIESNKATFQGITILSNTVDVFNFSNGEAFPIFHFNSSLEISKTDIDKQ